MILRTRVYIDGYNLYYGRLRKTPYKWLDPVMLFRSRILPSIGYIPAGHKTVPGVELLTDAGVKYFTATIMEKAAKAADSVSSQMIYHSALRAHLGSQIEVIKGYYSLTAVTQRSVESIRSLSSRTTLTSHRRFNSSGSGLTSSSA